MDPSKLRDAFGEQWRDVAGLTDWHRGERGSTPAPMRPFWDEREAGTLQQVHLDRERFRLVRELSREVALRGRVTMREDLRSDRLVVELETELARFLDRGRLELPAGTIESAKADAYRWILRAVWPRWLARVGRLVTRAGRAAERRWPVRMRTFDAVGYLPELVLEAGRDTGMVIGVWR